MRALLGLLLTLCLAVPLSAQEGSPYFEREALNAGLPPRPETFDLSTPQTALTSFLEAGAAGDWNLAAHALNLAPVAEPQQPQLGPLYARELYVVVDRKVLLRWQDLSERPDAVIETGSANDPMVGQPRRSVLLGILQVGGREVSIRLNRIKPGRADPVWVFAAPTVANVPALFEAYGPGELERMIPERFRVEVLWGLRAWEVLFLPLALGVIAWAGLTVWRGLSALSRRPKRRIVRRVVLSTRLPATIALIAGLLNYLTTNLVVVSSAAAAFIEPAVLLGFVAAVVILIVNVIDAALERIVDVDPAEMAAPERAGDRSLATGISAARRFVVVIAVILGAGIVLSSSEIFQTLGFSLLASAGVLTLVLGFAGREVIGNILASLQISLNRSARIGDMIVFDGRWCTVERIYFTYVQLKIWTGNRMIVPVSHFVREPFENWSHVEFKMLRLVELKLASTADVQPLRERMQAFVEGDDRIDPKNEAFAYVTSQDEFGMTVLFAVPVPVPDAGWAVECALREHLLTEAGRLGIALPAEPPRPDAA